MCFASNVVFELHNPPIVLGDTTGGSSILSMIIAANCADYPCSTILINYAVAMVDDRGYRAGMLPNDGCYLRRHRYVYLGDISQIFFCPAVELVSVICFRGGNGKTLPIIAFHIGIPVVI